MLSEESIASIRNENVIEFELRSASSEAIMKLFILADAVKRANEFVHLRLVAPYLPFGRQDRVCKPGESFSLEMFIKLVATTFDMLVTFDAHNQYVTEHLCERYNLKYQGKGVEEATAYIHELYLNEVGEVQYERSAHRLVLPKTRPFDELETLYVFPDYGAQIKYLRDSRIPKVFATKRRNYDKDGKMMSLAHCFEDKESVEILSKNTNAEVIVLDDICDGGATFSSLAQALRECGIRNKPTLCISHGIFSKGVEGIKQLLDDYDSIRLVDTSFNTNKLTELKLLS